MSSYQNLLKLHLCLPGTILSMNSEAFPPNLVKLTLRYIRIDGAVLEKLPKLRILNMDSCGYNEGKMDFSGSSDSFPQLEVLHFQYPNSLHEVTVDDVSMPKLNKVILKGA